MEQYTSVRFESLSLEKMKRNIKHDLRTIKIKSVINENENFIYVNDSTNGEYKKNDANIKKFSNKLIKNLDAIQLKHKQLLRSNYNRSLNKNRVNSFNSAVLTFSNRIDSLVKVNKDEVIKRGVKTIKNICNELNVELHYITLHSDEKGLPHFHFFTNNFDNTGKSISVKSNKGRGSELQDLGNLYFEELGFKRGINKTITKREHLTIRQYQTKLDNEREILVLKDEKKELKNMQDEAIKRLQFTINEFIEIGLKYKGKDLKGLWNLFERYVTGGNIKKMGQLENKLVTLINRNKGIKKSRLER